MTAVVSDTLTLETKGATLDWVLTESDSSATDTVAGQEKPVIREMQLSKWWNVPIKGPTKQLHCWQTDWLIRKLTS